MTQQKSKSIRSSEMEYFFRGKLWKHNGPGGWCFITVPKVHSRKIRKIHISSEEGWGRLKTLAIIGESSWKTAIWFDTKADAYLLPVKSLIRKQEKLQVGTKFEVRLKFEFEKWFEDNFVA
ncbi:MAG: DUF1905 domain-containing protein [Bacteriovoracaceae bacterium]